MCKHGDLYVHGVFVELAMEMFLEEDTLIIFDHQGLSIVFFINFLINCCRFCRNHQGCNELMIESLPYILFRSVGDSL